MLEALFTDGLQGNPVLKITMAMLKSLAMVIVNVSIFYKAYSILPQALLLLEWLMLLLF